ncbi:MAG TPA: hypothetical protein VHJ38_00430 [Nitrososphaeraceae archaeon]|jgi:hypothetical protein|nr:hypothetical protein [Nitrososphaeraceae archaeon]
MIIKIIKFYPIFIRTILVAYIFKSNRKKEGDVTTVNTLIKRLYILTGIEQLLFYCNVVLAGYVCYGLVTMSAHLPIHNHNLFFSSFYVVYMT